MKAIHYDAEGDILTVTFSEAGEQKHTGVQLSDNIILYFDPETEQPLELILSSYQATIRASVHTPIQLDRLQKMPARWQEIVMSLLQRAPLNGFIELDEFQAKTTPVSRLHEVFTLDAQQAWMAA